MPLLVTTSDLGDRCVQLKLSGEVDCATAPELREAINDVLCNRNPSTIYVDVEDITLLDSTGIGTLVVAHRIANDVCVRLTVVNPNRFVARLFGVLGVADLLGVSADDGDDDDGAAWPVRAQRAVKLLN
ncbi:MAG: STAS domain-containing protein [Micromonosporaceae bacterium]